MPTLSPEEQDWLLQSLVSLAASRGAAPLLTNPLLEPSDRFFPDAWEASERGVKVLAKRLLDYAGLPLTPEVVPFSQPDEIRELNEFGGAKAWGHEGAAAYFAGIEGSRCLFGCAVERMAEPEVVVATMAHEVAHAYRRFHGLEVDDRDEEERLTDVTTLFLGFGILTTNGSYLFRQSGRVEGNMTYTQWSHQHAGYLPPEAMSFLLAAQAEARGLGFWQRRRLAGLLEPNQSAFFRAARSQVRGHPLLAELRAPGGRPGTSPTTAAPALAPMKLEGPVPEALEAPKPNAGRRTWRVRRDKAIPRGFLGMLAGMAVGIPAMVASGRLELGLLLVGVGTVVGRSIGKHQRWDYCSDPACAADLDPRDLACPRCGGTISGDLDDPSKRPLDDDEKNAFLS
ncbi:MAG: hypothetical protein QM765_39735 [Myxococcales bacterium]